MNSKKIKVLIVIGTRPEAIKMMPVVQELSRCNIIDLKVCVTAQHRQMLDQVLSLFSVVPEFDLNLMLPGQDLTDITSKILLGMRGVFTKWRPNIVFVHGDTTTTLATSIAAYYEKIKIAHVEAGLRTGDIYSPWPEEGNRRMVGAITDMHLAPTNTAKQNLINEGISPENIWVTGNTVIDALFSVIAKLRDDVNLQNKQDQFFSFLNPKKKLILVTGHRRENIGGGFVEICQALQKISSREDVEIIYPVHLNPNVQEPVSKILGGLKNVHLIEPLEYLSFVYLMNRAYLIVTDSGGIQEEAPSLGKPVLVMREVTERPEAVEAGTVRLIGNKTEVMVKEIGRLLDDAEAYEEMSKSNNPYGDGYASRKILEIIKSKFIDE